MVILACYISPANILMSTSVLTLSCWHTIAVWIYVYLFVDVTCRSYRFQYLFLLFRVILLLGLLLWRLLIAFEQIFALVKVSLRARLSLVSSSTTCHRPLTIISCCRSSPVWSCSSLVAEIVKIVEHQVHVFLLVLL